MNKRASHQDQVAQYLFDRWERWVPGYDLETPEVGGQQGTRRVRRLRELGFEIEGRPKKGSSAWEYRMVGAH